MKKKSLNTVLKAVVIVVFVAIINLMGVAFLALKMVSIPFVPNRNIGLYGKVSKAIL